MSETKSFEEILEENGVLVYTFKGFSMWPLLRQNTDFVVIRKPDRDPKKYDIVLFKAGNSYILHRIIRIDGDMITTAGDHNTFKDQSISKGKILGFLTSYVRDGKEIDVSNIELQIYGHLVTDLFPLKAACLKIKAVTKRTVRKLRG